MNILVGNVLPSRIIPDDLKSSGLALVLVFIPDIPHPTNHNGYNSFLVNDMYKSSVHHEYCGRKCSPF